ncbi:YkgJ family cysteine cluster protein [Candidatus Woesearchaeota archaeon]|nr:YkgJ family cysteine cluster protein [Candidatus Woesearchaeota archaeon]
MRGKIKRFLTAFLPVDKNRTGKCNRCGACCMLPFKCPFLRFDENNKAKCLIYLIRPPMCRKYPRTDKEHITKDTCGFGFK